MVRSQPEHLCEQPGNSSCCPTWTSPEDIPEPGPARGTKVKDTHLFCVCVCILIYACACRCVIYQHKVDVEVQNLVAHIHTEVVAEMVSQVGEGSCWALEMSAGHLHPLKMKQKESVGLCEQTKWPELLCAHVCVSLTSSDTLLSMAPNMECKAPADNPQISLVEFVGFVVHTQ